MIGVTTALTFVQAELAGTAGATSFAQTVRSTRTWKHHADGWKVVAAHASNVN